MIPELIGQETKAGTSQRTIRWVMDEEHRLLMHGNRRGDAECLPFMPFQPAEFIAIMFDVVAETSGPVFLDVGCGTGTKMTLAKEFFGLTPWGIEIDEAMAAQADARFPWGVIEGNALDPITNKFYSEADIIWLYRPFRDPGKQTRLEERVMERMKHGAILAGSKWQMDSPPNWIPIVDDWDATKSGSVDEAVIVKDALFGAYCLFAFCEGSKVTAPSTPLHPHAMLQIHIPAVVVRQSLRRRALPVHRRDWAYEPAK